MLAHMADLAHNHHWQQKLAKNFDIRINWIYKNKMEISESIKPLQLAIILTVTDPNSSWGNYNQLLYNQEL